MFNNINNKSWFNNKVLFIISLVIMFFSSIVSAFAVSSYLYNSNEVSFNNASSTSISSSNVQGAIDELYADAHNYEEMNTRVTALEGHFVDDPNITLQGTSGYNWIHINGESGKDMGVALKSGDKRRSAFYYDPGTDRTYVAAYDSSSNWGQGTLDLKGNPVKVNGVDIKSKWDYLGGACSLNTSTTTNYTISNISNYFLLRINISYYAQGLPDYGGITIPTAELKRASSEAIWVYDVRNSKNIRINYVNDTTVKVMQDKGTSYEHTCFSIHGVL